MDNQEVSAYQSAYNHPLLNSLIDLLTINEFISTRVSHLQPRAIDPNDLRKSIWLASILASSINEAHVKKAQLFAALVHLNFSNNIDIARSAYVLFSRTGNLTATKFLTALSIDNRNQENDSRRDFGLSLNLELEYNRNESTITVSKKNFLATRFQQTLWHELHTHKNIAISAPTSSGKSFIIKKYIEEQAQLRPVFRALYIVPSRALINQVSEELRKDINHESIEIKTAFIVDKEEVVKNKTIYVLTPERCLKLLQYSWTKHLQLDFVFVDEIQNVEEESGRGTLMEYVLREIALLSNLTQIISAGPNINDTDKLFSRIFGINNTKIQTSVSPVFQIKTIIKPESNYLKLTVKSQIYNEFQIDIPTDVDVKKKFNQNIGTGLPDIIRYLGGEYQNLIYSSRTDYVEDWALKFVNTKIPPVTNSKEVRELIEFLKEEIHPYYYLIECIERGVAFHHSKLPDIARKEIEDLFLNGSIKNLFCTSTLIEGVNLPANNLFIVLPKKRTDNLSPFEFGNLIGRAGRIKDSLYGAVYCIERNDKEWANDYYTQAYEKDVISVSEKSLFNSKEFIDKLKLTTNQLDSARDLNTSIFLRHKILKDKNEFINYLTLKNVDHDEIQAMLSILENTVSEVTISPDILRLNPTIDPLLQQKLHKQITDDGISEWTITFNKNFYKWIKSADVENYKFNELNLYWQLVSISERLNNIFNIREEAYVKQNISLSLRQMCLYGTKWITGKSYKQLIEEDIRFHSQHLNPSNRIDPNNKAEVNKRIKEVIDISSTAVSYILVKYLKLLNDHLESIMNEKEKETHKFALALPMMMELGTTEPMIMQLMSHGIPRSIALKIFEVFPYILREAGVDILKWLREQTTIGLKPIYEKYLRKMQILKGI